MNSEDQAIKLATNISQSSSTKANKKSKSKHARPTDIKRKISRKSFLTTEEKIPVESSKNLPREINSEIKHIARISKSRRSSFNISNFVSKTDKIPRSKSVNMSSLKNDLLENLTSGQLIRSGLVANANISNDQTSIADSAIVSSRIDLGNNQPDQFEKIPAIGSERKTNLLTIINRNDFQENQQTHSNTAHSAEDDLNVDFSKFDFKDDSEDNSMQAQESNELKTCDNKFEKLKPEIESDDSIEYDETLLIEVSNRTVNSIANHFGSVNQKVKLPLQFLEEATKGAFLSLLKENTEEKLLSAVNNFTSVDFHMINDLRDFSTYGNVLATCIEQTGIINIMKKEFEIKYSKKKDEIDFEQAKSSLISEPQGFDKFSDPIEDTDNKETKPSTSTAMQLRKRLTINKPPTEQSKPSTSSKRKNDGSAIQALKNSISVKKKHHSDSDE